MDLHTCNRKTLRELWMVTDEASDRKNPAWFAEQPVLVIVTKEKYIFFCILTTLDSKVNE